MLNFHMKLINGLVTSTQQHHDLYQYTEKLSLQVEISVR